MIHDLKHALRLFVKNPGFAAIAVATLALGIGANAAIFALIDRVLLTRLPVRNPRELVLLASPGPLQGHVWTDGDISKSFSSPMYRQLAQGRTALAGLLAEYPFAASVATPVGTDRAAGELVSGNYFDLLGAPAAVGRILTPQDDRSPGAHPVAVLSHGYWTRRFGSNAAILNTSIIINGYPLTVVGVARPGFSGLQPGRSADLFVPLMMKAQMTPFWNGLEDPKDYWLQLVGRLRPGASRQQAETALQSIYTPLLQSVAQQMSFSSDSKRKEFLAKKIRLLPGGYGRTVLKDSVGTALVSLMAMVGLVLLIACSNLAGLLAARGAARQREYGIRLAIGASRFALVRQSIAECLLFAGAGGALGLLVASWTLHALLETFPPDADVRQVAAQVDPRVLGFAAFVSLLSGLLFGIAPAWRAARLDPARTLRGSGRGSAAPGADVVRFRQGLVTAQIALTLVLLVAAGLFARSLSNLGRVDLGLNPDHVVGFSIAPELSGYSAPRSAALARSLTESLMALPGVRSASAAEVPTLTGDDSGSNIKMEGIGIDPRPGESTHVRMNWIGPGYFSTLGIPLLSGREVSWRDDAAAPRVAVVNESFVRRFVSGRDALGARLRLGREDRARPAIEIVGVVRNSKAAEVAEKDGPFLYLPYAQDDHLGTLTFYVLAQSDPGGLASSLRAAVNRLDPQLPVFDIKPLDRQIQDSLVTQRLITMLSVAFGVLAALLAALGIYGVLAYSVAQRRQEIGVRIALGADPAAVRRLILGEVVRFLAVGAAIGLPASYALARAVSSILFGVGAADARVFAAGVILLAAVSLSAAYLPARRAARTDAMEALRSE